MEPLPPTPPLPKESVLKRYKLIWRLVFTANLALGAYMFVKEKTKDTDAETSDDARKGSAAAELSSVPIVGSIPCATMEALKVREPIPAEQQLELFKWILEEKRKVKPKDSKEKKQIDEEKAILKQFMKSKSIPSL